MAGFDRGHTSLFVVVMVKFDAEGAERSAMNTTTPGSRHVRSMVALLEAQASEIRALQRTVRNLEGRLEVLVELDAMVADQLCAPLATIERALEELREHCVEPRCRELVDETALQLHAMNGVISELVEPQKVGPVPVERARVVRLPLDGLVEQALSVVGHRLPRSQVEVELPPGYMVTTAPRRFMGILVNLLENAVAHGAGPIECRAETWEGWLRIEVADRGPGLAGADPESLFQPLPAPDEGEDPEPGSGLYLVRMLARSLGGEATVTDRLGGGMVATVDLPQRRSGEQAATADSPPVVLHRQG
ncbi:MAG: HAMP domain-containing histidine kinase [Actinomycetota bacterium]|nr:HAMP domain-containing histidine kinase [Actinomycetota bacterium]